jgi:hypothetical protein
MPTRKISDSTRQYCRDSEHNPPQFMVWEDGTYEHECPSCHHKTIFTVANPTYSLETATHEQLDAMASVLNVRRWSPDKTEECPIPDTLGGGYCETDAQLRKRLLK